MLPRESASKVSTPQKNSCIHINAFRIADCKFDPIRKADIVLNILIHSQYQETDAGLLGVISYPAFAVDDQELIDHTRETIVDKLQVQYMG